MSVCKKKKKNYEELWLQNGVLSLKNALLSFQTPNQTEEIAIDVKYIR